MKKGPRPLELKVSEEERKGLEVLVSRHKTPQQLAKRGRIVLAAGERKKERGDCQRRESECGYGSYLAWALEQFAKHPAHRTVHQCTTLGHSAAWKASRDNRRATQPDRGVVL